MEQVRRTKLPSWQREQDDSRRLAQQWISSNPSAIDSDYTEGFVTPKGFKDRSEALTLARQMGFKGGNTAHGLTSADIKAPRYESELALASAPRRAYESMTFDPPFAAPFGQILSYHWMSKPVGGMEGQRTSDWSQARTNAVTGRGIVHHFKVQKPDGTHTVSLETALGQLSDPQRQRLQGLIRAEQTRRADQASGQMALFSAPRITEPPFSTAESKALENTRIHAIDTYLHGTRRPIAKTPPADQAGSSRTQLQALLTHLRRAQRASGSSAGNEQTGRTEARQRDKALLIDWARNAGVLINAIPTATELRVTSPPRH